MGARGGDPPLGLVALRDKRPFQLPRPNGTLNVGPSRPAGRAEDTMASSLTFLGGTGTVTGSKFLLQHGDRRLMVDCGLYQGEREWRRLNWQELPVPANSISDVLLTHAHLDHCGYLPALVRQGFSGPAWATRGTAELAAIVLRDSAHLQVLHQEFIVGARSR